MDQFESPSSRTPLSLKGRARRLLLGIRVRVGNWVENNNLNKLSHYSIRLHYAQYLPVIAINDFKQVNAV